MSKKKKKLIIILATTVGVLFLVGSGFPNIFLSLLVLAMIFVFPLAFTGMNIYILFSQKYKLAYFMLPLTVVIGSVSYWLLLDILNVRGKWFESIYATEFHEPISSAYSLGFLLPILLGYLGMLVLTYAKSDENPPLITALSIASVLIMDVFQILFAIQICKNFYPDFAFPSTLYTNNLFLIYHLNIIVISMYLIRKQLQCMKAIFEQMCMENLELQDFSIEETVEKAEVDFEKEQNGIAEKILKEDSLKNAEQVSSDKKRDKLYALYGKIDRMSKYSTLIFICMFALIAVMEIIFIITGQGFDAFVKAFTDTADWTFSKQIPPPPMEYEGHYLCTVAAGGHKKVVKPQRFGLRRGAIIIVNRQLCIANAFEDYIQEKTPRFHRFIRHCYDKYGYPVSKLIDTPLKADFVYFIMKPLEWAFLVFLYLFDARPEKRIKNQYVLK